MKHQRIVVGLLATLLAITTAPPALAGGPHRPHHGSGHRQEQDVAVAKKGGKTKTVKRTFSSEGAIAIPEVDGVGIDSGAADPYPSTIDVTGFKKARITDVNLTLRGFSHTFVADVNILLVAPGGRNAFVLGNVSEASEESAVSDLALTLDDEADAALPRDSLIASGSFRPGFVAELQELPAPAPALSGEVALSTFDGLDPNGQWQLFIFDDNGGDAGSVEDGWSLQIAAKEKVKNKGKGKRKR